ncbi:outer membrane protein [Tepidicaulis sp. LMO-SS28]|uniref:outer membrane protein n=1 Tax=Tepidicaulis sp. LMO-SS28 TaxID=3447455 RepID=UPI003EE062DE
MNFKSVSIGAVSAAALFIMGGVAQAEPAKPGMYVSFGGGMNWVDDSEDSGVTVEFKDGYTLQGAIGYDSGDFTDMGKFRVEGEISYTENDNDKISGGGLSFDVGGQVEQTAVMANAYWDFIPGGTLRPYVGFGIGMADVEVEASAGGFTASGSETEAAYRGMLGLTYHMNQNWALDVGYRYTVVAFDNDLENSSLLASLRYKF